MLFCGADVMWVPSAAVEQLVRATGELVVRVGRHEEVTENDLALTASAAMVRAQNMTCSWTGITPVVDRTWTCPRCETTHVI